MAKKMPSIAIVICSVMMLTSNASAGWLDIVKGIVGGIIGVPLQQSAQPPQSAQQPANPAPAAPGPAQAAAPPTEEQIAAALDSLTAVCAKLSTSGLPCGIGIGKGNTLSNAQKVANTRSIQALGESIKASLESNSQDILNQIEKDGVIVEENIFNQAAAVTAQSEIAGSQVYLSYTHKKGNTYEILQLRVLNPAIFERALASSAAGESLSKQLLQESLKGATEKIKAYYVKNKK